MISGKVVDCDTIYWELCWGFEPEAIFNTKKCRAFLGPKKKPFFGFFMLQKLVVEARGVRPLASAWRIQRNPWDFLHRKSERFSCSLEQASFRYVMSSAFVIKYGLSVTPSLSAIFMFAISLPR